MVKTLHVLNDYPSERCYAMLMSLVVPRPIAWISTYNDDGSVNLAPYALFAVVSTEPAIIQFASRRPKDTYHNAVRRGAFTVNFASVKQQAQVAATSQELPYGESEVERVGLTCTAAKRVEAPLVEQCLAALECRTWDTATVGGSVVTYGEVVAIHMDDTIIADDGLADFTKLDPLTKLGRNQWGATQSFR